MARRKPIREMDAILIRVPDGLKERLSRRAVAHGRSMNAELVSILTEVLDTPNDVELRKLEETYRSLKDQKASFEVTLEGLEMQLRAVERELADMKNRSSADLQMAD